MLFTGLRVIKLFSFFSCNFIPFYLHLLSTNKNMDKESIYELQKIDCNCNNCGHFQRDIELTKLKNSNSQIVANKIHYGQCLKLNKLIGEIANITLLHTQECFTHRKDLIK